MQKDDLIKLFSRDHLARLDNIKQWLEYDRHQQESVSQHSYKVSVFTMCLLDYLWPGGGDNNTVATFKYQTLKMALMHDFDEAILRRDITHELAFPGQYPSSVLQTAPPYPQFPHPPALSFPPADAPAPDGK